MNKHLEQYLVQKYPKIFEEYGGDPKKTCMGWGMSHGDGWFFLLDALCGPIQQHIDHPPLVYKKTVKAYAIRAWNWFVKIFPSSWKYQIYEDIMEPGVVPQVVALQVKEKFGGLRFYCRGGDTYIRGMVALAEALSYRICETCGVMNELVNCNGVGWIQTTCPCCTRDKESHLERRDTELVELWKKVQDERNNDRRKKAV